MPYREAPAAFPALDLTNGGPRGAPFPQALGLAGQTESTGRPSEEGLLLWFLLETPHLTEVLY